MANGTDSPIKKLQAEVRALFDGPDAALGDESQSHPLRRFIRFWVLVGRTFVLNRCLVRASALAYTTLLALIPLLAVGVGVSTSLLNSQQEQTRQLIEKVIDQLAPQLGDLPGTAEEKAQRRVEMVERVQSFIANIHSGALGVTGTAALLFVAIGLLSTIEATFNDIWGVPRGRNWFVRVVHYWAAITLGPLAAVFVISLTVSGQFEAARSFVSSMGTLGSLFFKCGPILVLCGAFVLLYKLMPNTHVHWRAAMIGSLVAGLLWIANGNLSALFASRVLSASKIYGPLGAIPIFLFGLYLSWTILLFGAQVAYAFQNRRAYAQELQAESINQRGREFIALRLMTLVGQRFQRGDPPPGVTEIADALGVSSRLVSRIVQPLMESRLLLEVATPESAYCPARSLDRITCGDVLESLRSGQGRALATREGPARELVRGTFDEIRDAEERLSRSITLAQMVQRAEAASPTTAAPRT